MSDRPPLLIPLGDVSPDLGHIVMAGENPHLLLALSVWPHGGAGYVPARDLATQGISSFAGQPTGSCLFNKDYLYYGTAEGQLIEVDYATGAIAAKLTVPTSGYESVQAWRGDDDGGGSAYTDITVDVNDVGGPDAQPFPTGAGADDAIYLGYAAPQTSLNINVGTAGVGSYTGTWEYSNTAGGWSSLAGVSDGTNDFKNAGTNALTFTQPTDHGTVAVGGVSAYYYRLRRDGGAVTTDPVLTQVTAGALVQAWREDNNGGASFADITTDVNDAGGPDAQPFPTVAAVDDALYLGYSAEQTKLAVNVGTAGAGAYSVVWEYSTAAGGWSTLPSVSDGTNGFKNSGLNDVTFTQPTDHQAASVGGVMAFWYRCRISAFSSMSTIPVLTQVTSDYTHERKWSLVRFGDSVIATNEWDPVQVQTVRGESFRDLITTADKPQARYCTTFQGRLVLGWVKVVDASSNLGQRGDYPYTVWMSGIQQANNFDPTDAVFLSLFQTLTTEWGEITGVCEIVDQVIVMFERAAYRVSGGGLLPASYSFLPVVGATGSRHPRSLVSHGGALHYWGDAGPAIITPSGYGELGADKLTTTLLSPSWPVPVEVSLDRTADEPDVVGAACPSTTSILWRYPATDSTLMEILLVWNYRTGRFSMIPILNEGGGDARSVRLMVDRGDMPEAWEIGSTLALGLWDGTDTELYQFSTTAQAGEEAAGSGLLNPPRFVLAFQEYMEDQITAPQQLQVVASPAAGSSGVPELSVTVNGKRDPAQEITASDTVTITTDDAAVTSGWLPLHVDDGEGGSKSPKATRFQQLDLTVTPTATWKAAEIQALRLRLEGHGDY